MSTMPVFVIKAKDNLAFHAIDYYALLCRKAGLANQAAEVEKALEEMRAWRIAHPDQINDPDHRHVPVEEMADRLHSKYRVERTDGRDQPGGDKAGARYFVLDYVHDPYARAALAAYIEACQATLPGLADDLRHQLADAEGAGTR